ncbi:hypothetical protein O181_018489 [Austropuccinia psidii MF-1]|uniref:Uncharacterized protein n=1 Tax=Austropuccinia psidii MF-1 TaxID=1389203 RepID=A0A9Q3C7S4_9BASI|nr:hypothetical protein [Austropuccinia psidii MF-1]
MPPYACPGSLFFSRIPTPHTQILMPVQDPNTSHAKPCTVNPYAGAAFQQCQQFLMAVQTPNASQAKYLALYRFPTIKIIPYARAASQKLRHFLMWVQAPKASHANPYTWAGSPQFKQLLTPEQASESSHTNAYACKGSQSFTHTSLLLYRFPTIKTIPYTWAASQQF